MAKRKKQPPPNGTVFEVPYPFLRCVYDDGDPDGGAGLSWKPGAHHGEDYMGRTQNRYHGIGKQVLTVVGSYEPAGFPTRIFYTRKWVDPDGRAFGKRKCLIMTAEAFRRRVKGYAFPLVQVKPTPEETALPPRYAELEINYP